MGSARNFVAGAGDIYGNLRDIENQSYQRGQTQSSRAQINAMRQMAAQQAELTRLANRGQAQNVSGTVLGAPNFGPGSTAPWMTESPLTPPSPPPTPKPAPAPKQMPVPEPPPAGQQGVYEQGEYPVGGDSRIPHPPMPKPESDQPVVPPGGQRRWGRYGVPEPGVEVQPAPQETAPEPEILRDIEGSGGFGPNIYDTQRSPTGGEVGPEEYVPEIKMEGQGYHSPEGGMPTKDSTSIEAATVYPRVADAFMETEVGSQAPEIDHGMGGAFNLDIEPAIPESPNMVPGGQEYFGGEQVSGQRFDEFDRMAKAYTRMAQLSYLKGDVESAQGNIAQANMARVEQYNLLSTQAIVAAQRGDPTQILAIMNALDPGAKYSVRLMPDGSVTVLDNGTPVGNNTQEQFIQNSRMVIDQAYRDQMIKLNMELHKIRMTELYKQQKGMAIAQVQGEYNNQGGRFYTDPYSDEAMGYYVPNRGGSVDVLQPGLPPQGDDPGTNPRFLPIPTR